jgi:hypothetical protein
MAQYSIAFRMTQEIITYGIITVAISFAGYLIFRKNFSKKKSDDCTDCAGGDKCSGCPLKDMQVPKKKE